MTFITLQSLSPIQRVLRDYFFISPDTDIVSISPFLDSIATRALFYVRLLSFRGKIPAFVYIFGCPTASVVQFGWPLLIDATCRGGMLNLSTSGFCTAGNETERATNPIKL